MDDEVREEMISIDGFEDAIIGTALKQDGETEVLVYDGYKAAEIFKSIDPNVDISLYLKFLDAQGEGDRTPVFVYLDKSVKEDVVEQQQQRTYIH